MEPVKKCKRFLNLKEKPSSSIHLVSKGYINILENRLFDFLKLITRQPI